ncbi:MAG: S8 family serine peptidase, partial [Nanoarchaeota archaeon]|nr:S8 family serine peptidase [Nanoarchaeota archaeon]
MTEVYNSLQQQGVEIKYSLQLINSIAADVSFNTIEILANDEYIKKIYLDRKIQILPQDIIFERKNYELNRKIKNEEDRPITPMLYESTKLIDAPFMWDLGFNGSGVKIAILDTGIDDTHPDLEGKVVAKRDFTLFDNELKTEDGNGHGTHVAGIAAGTGAGSVKDIDTSSTDTSGLSNLPFSPNTYHVGAGIFQFDWEEETVVDVFLGQVDENSGFTYDFVMGDNISSFTVTISWLDSSDDIDMRLRNPAGDIYAWSIGVTNYESIHVENPEQGTWSLEVYPYSVTGT